MGWDQKYKIDKVAIGLINWSCLRVPELGSEHLHFYISYNQSRPCPQSIKWCISHMMSRPNAYEALLETASCIPSDTEDVLGCSLSMFSSRLSHLHPTLPTPWATSTNRYIHTIHCVFLHDGWNKNEDERCFGNVKKRRDCQSTRVLPCVHKSEWVEINVTRQTNTRECISSTHEVDLDII